MSTTTSQSNPAEVLNQSPTGDFCHRFLPAARHAMLSNISQRTRDISLDGHLLTNSRERATYNRVALRYCARRTIKTQATDSLPAAFRRFSIFLLSNGKQNGNDSRSATS